GDDVLEPYKKIIDRWLWPDLFRKQDTSVSQAKLGGHHGRGSDAAGTLSPFIAEIFLATCSRFFIRRQNSVLDSATVLVGARF
ncbi:MAG: hypothetical protein LAO23_17035, partial [Acidobacteriia bacterium]|nr:hypothetical protein [Terriglobia bacterium]